MKTKAINESYEQLFREFAVKQLDRKYSPRKVGRGAACQEYVRYEADLAKDPLPREGCRVLAWSGADGITRLASFKVIQTGKNTLKAWPEAGNKTALAQADILKNDIAGFHIAVEQYGSGILGRDDLRSAVQGTHEL